MLVKHPGLREASGQLARAVGPGDTRLVAYVVGRGVEPVSGAELRRWLKPRLPEYMVPSAFMAIGAMPLTEHGKVDRDALPFPELSARGPEGEYEPPRTAIEEVVASTWSAVLGVDRVGIHDNFFDLGGHSLLATQVVSRLRDTLGVEVPLRNLFEATTVAALAERIETASSGSLKLSTDPIAAVARDGPMPASFAQESLWFLDQLAPDQPTFNVTAAVLVTGPLDVPALERAFAEIVARHESLRTRFATSGGSPVQVIDPPGRARLEQIDLREFPEDDRLAEAARKGVAESRRPFNLARGPLACARS